VKCRHCTHDLQLSFLELGSAPPSNAYLTQQTLLGPEVHYPLRVLVCENCWLVQTEDHAGREALFDENYAYFSSFSSTWLAHAKSYVQAMQERFELGTGSTVVDVAANDGYLLQYVQQLGIPCYGIEPTASTAAAARTKGIEIIEDFFGVALATELGQQTRQADLMSANNVLAHVPNINDFVKGFAQLLKPQGVATFEFPHLMRMVQFCQFDTAYHEHYSYLSLTAVQRIFATNGLSVFDVEELATHGGSLRVYAQRTDTGAHDRQSRVSALLHIEQEAGIETTAFYRDFQNQPERIVRELLSFLVAQVNCRGRVAAYGAAAKGNTLLNFAGVRPHLLPYVVDMNPAKQGKFMPGSRIPIVDEAHLRAHRPTHVLILPWNLKQEVMEQLAYIREWGGKFVTAVPTLEVLP
jgi:ubiquinone/menaquinone biosynthesis C-methylase UbiE